MPKKIVQGITLSQLADGYAGKAVDAGLKRITEDLIDRGNDGKARTMTVKYTFTPDETGVEIEVDVATKIPSYKPQKTRAKVDERAGGLTFSPDRAANPDQFALPMAGVEDGE